MRSFSTSRRAAAVGHVVAALALAATGCNGAGDGPIPSSRASRPLVAPLRLSPPGIRLFSPRPSPDGRWVAVSGSLGRGLFVLPTDGTGRLVVVDEAYRGPTAWTEASALVFGHERKKAFRPATGRTEETVASWHGPWDDRYGSLLAASTHGRLYHHPREGTVTWVDPEGRAHVQGDEMAWGAVADPTGRMVAWCAGRLSRARLRVWDLATGRVYDLGRGTHPAWSASGRLLVFARPLEAGRSGSLVEIRRSELLAWRPGLESPRPLFQPNSAAPMEPAVGPKGRYVYFSDWTEGAIYRLEIGGVP